MHRPLYINSDLHGGALRALRQRKLEREGDRQKRRGRNRKERKGDRGKDGDREKRRRSDRDRIRGKRERDGRHVGRSAKGGTQREERGDR